MSELNIPGFIAFLRGEVTIDGHWFGGDGPIRGGIRRNFWWREHLPKLSSHIERQDAEIAQLRADLSESHRLLDVSQECVLALRKELIAFQKDVEGAEQKDLSFAMACVRDVEGITVRGALEMQREEIALLRKELADARRLLDEARITLVGIAGATARAWELPRSEFIDEFLPWAQSRARDTAAKIAAPVPAQPAVCDDCGALCTPANNAKSHIKRCAACQSAFVASLDSAITAQPAAAKGSTHCDECGCDWLDNGLNPVGCPYCKRNDDKFNPCLNSLVRQVTLMMDDCEEHADGTITIDCDISQGFLRRIYDLLSALEDGGYDAIEPQQPAAVPEAVAKDVSALDDAGQSNRKVAYAWFPLRISRKRQLISDCGITLPQALTESDSQWAMRALLAMLERADCRAAILSAADAEVKNNV